MLISIQKPQRLKIKYLIPQTLLLPRLTKLSFDARMEKAAKSLETKCHVNNPLDITQKYTEIIKILQTLDH